MFLRLLTLLMITLGLTLLGACSKRETKQVEPSKGAKGGESTTSPGNSDDGEEGSNSSDGADTDPESDSESGEIGDPDPDLPGGLSQSEYDEGKLLVGSWDGTSDKADPNGQWTTRSKPNPDSIEDSGTSTATATGSSSVQMATITQHLNAHCTSCHSAAGSQATSDFTKPDVVQRFEAGIKRRVASDNMPPSGGLSEGVKKDFAADWSTTAAPVTGQTPANGQGNGGIY